MQLGACLVIIRTVILPCTCSHFYSTSKRLFPSPSKTACLPRTNRSFLTCSFRCHPAANRPFPSPADISMDSSRLEAELHLPLTPFNKVGAHPAAESCTS